MIAAFVFAPLQLILQLTLALDAVERGFLLPIRLHKRLRRAFRSYGTKWKQSCNIQACGYHSCCCSAGVVVIRAVLVILFWQRWAVIYEAKSTAKRYFQRDLLTMGELCLLGSIGNGNSRCTLPKVWITQVLLIIYINSQKGYHTMRDLLPNPRGLQARFLH